MKKIVRFSDAARFLSNFYPAVVRLDGKDYPSVEHAYQASKTLNLHLREIVRRSRNPGTAKALGKTLQLRDDWEQVKVDVMRDLVRQKFGILRYAYALIATGDAELIEGNDWGDRFWGMVPDKNGVLHGENHLGKILMQIREEVRSVQGS